MDDGILRERLNEIGRALSAASDAAGAGALRGSYVSDAPPVSTQSPEQLLDCLRLRVKYLTFDLEATRRENRYLRERLQRRGNPEDPSEGTA